MKIEADRDVCISAGNCVMTAETVFDQDDDGIVVLLTEDVADGPEGIESRVREAVRLCPSGALHLRE